MINYFSYPGLDKTGLSIKKVVCKHWKISEEDFDSKKRGKVSEARKVVYYLLKTQLGYKHTKIAKIFGVNQSIVPYSCKTTKNLLEVDKRFQYKYNLVLQDLNIARINKTISI